MRAESLRRLANELRGKTIVPTMPLAKPFFVHRMILASVSTANIGNPVASKPATIKFAEAKFDKFFDLFSASRKRFDSGLMIAGVLAEADGIMLLLFVLVLFFEEFFVFVATCVRGATPLPPEYLIDDILSSTFDASDIFCCCC